jgi:hypothetical protein
MAKILLVHELNILALNWRRRGESRAAFAQDDAQDGTSAVASILPWRRF